MAEGDLLTQLQKVANIIAVIGVPLVLSYLGFIFNDNLKTRDTRLRTTELAIAILRDDPKNSPEMPSLRLWAVNVIDDFSGVRFPEGAKKELQQNRLVGAKPYEMTFEDRLLRHLDYLWEELERRGVDTTNLGCSHMFDDDALSKYSYLRASSSERDQETYMMLSSLRASCRLLHGMA